MPPRYLYGPTDPEFAAVFLARDRQLGRARTFGREGQDLDVGPADRWEDVQARLAGWQPDFLLVGLGRVPGWLDRCPLPRVALAPDWDLCWNSYLRMLPFCDLVVADPNGVEAFRRQGVTCPLLAATLCGPWHPATPARAGGRDLDVLVAGPLDLAGRRQRRRLLARLTPLLGRYRVAVRPDGYQPLLPRARVVLEHSNRGACNRRAFEAVAAGCLLFQEAGNREAERVFGGGVVLYREEDLVTLLEHYLGNEAARRDRAEQAQRQAADQTPEQLWAGLLEAVAARLGEIRAHARGRHTPGPSDFDRALAAQAGAGGPVPPGLVERLTQLTVAWPQEPAFPHALGLLAGLGPPDPGRAAQAAGHFARALGRDPAHLLAGLNRAEALAAAGQAAEAAAQARRTLVLLDTPTGPEEPTPAWPGEDRYPPALDPFRAEWERAGWEHAGDPRRLVEARRRLLRWRLHGLLARQTGSLPHRYEAALARPDLPATRAALASSLVRAGLGAEAASQLRQALDLDPFQPAAARALADLLAGQGRADERGRLAEDYRRWSEAAPALVPPEAWFLPARPEGGRPADPAAPVPLPRLPAAPAATPLLSLCMIVRDEEDNLPGCLDSVRDLVDELIVVDTGSADRTLEVALRHRARVIDFPWQDSFAAARNESLRHARGEWVLWLDADERLDGPDRLKLRRLLASPPPEDVAFLMGQRSAPDAVTGAVLLVEQARLFRRLPEVRWQYRVHEQILPALVRRGARACRTDILVQHHGYQDPALRGRKLERNFRLLTLQTRDGPADSFTLFNLGSLLLDRAQTEDALDTFRRALADSPEGSSLLPKLHGLVAHCHRLLGRHAEALAACRQGRARLGEHPELLFQEAVLARETGDPDAAERCLTRLLGMPRAASMACVDEGVYGHKALHQRALALRQLGRTGEAEASWRQALADRADFVPAWMGLADLLLDQGRAAELEGDLGGLEAGPAGAEAGPVLRSWLLLRRGDPGGARGLLAGVAEARPWALWPRVLLAEALVALGDDQAAILGAVEKVLQLDPHHAWARRQHARLRGGAVGREPEGR